MASLPSSTQRYTRTKTQYNYLLCSAVTALQSMSVMHDGGLEYGKEHDLA